MDSHEPMHGATVAQVLALPPHSKKVLGSHPHGALLVLGAGSPQAFSAQVGYLPGLSVWSLHVHNGFPPLRTPTEKNMQKNRTLFVRP